MPMAPRTHQEAGLSLDLLIQLALKTLHFAGELTGGELARRLGVNFSVVEPALDFLKAQRQVEIGGGTMVGRASYRYRITDAGRPRAALFLEANHYVGVAPVPFEQYRHYMLGFAKTAPRTATRDRVREAFSHLVISQERARPARSGDQRRPLDVRLRPPGQRQDGHLAGGPQAAAAGRSPFPTRSKSKARSSGSSIPSITNRS